MNLSEYRIEAEKLTPKVTVNVLNGIYRHDIINYLKGYSNIGIELGVAEGQFSQKLVNSQKFKLLFGVDAYSDIHDTQEYKHALQRIGLEKNHKLLRMNFTEAIDLFPDNYFDFIYIDGFAHTGEEGGQTLIDWYKKLKIGGIMSGDDYHSDWPLVIWAVNHFASQLEVDLTLTEIAASNKYSNYPTWFFEKPTNLPAQPLTTDPRLVEIALNERERIRILRDPSRADSLHFRLKRFVKRLAFNPSFFFKKRD